MRTLTLVFLLLLPAISFADPWCLIRDEAQLCRYKTSDACYKEAARRGGDCRENYKEIGVSGVGPWCVVTATYRRCVFNGKRGCLRQAQAVGGGCVKNVERDLELALRNKSDGGNADCEDLACELRESARDSISQQTEQVGVDDGDF